MFHYLSMFERSYWVFIPGHLRASVGTSWASDATLQRMNQTYANRLAGVRLVAWIRTQRVAQTVDLLRVKLTSGVRHFGYCLAGHRLTTAIQFEPECLRLVWRCWRSSERENSAISVGVHDTRCYRSGFQSLRSERQRARSSRSPFAAPVYFRPRQVSEPANITTALASCCSGFIPSRPMFDWGFAFAVWRYGAHFEGKTSDSPLVFSPGQLLLLPLGHNNSISWRLFDSGAVFPLYCLLFGVVLSFHWNIILDVA